MLNNVGEKIKQLRIEAGLSGRKLAKLSQHHPSLISKIESGVTKPSLDSLAKICGVLGISLSDFFSGDPVPLPRNLLELLETAQDLSTEEQKMLTKLLKTFGMKFTPLFTNQNKEDYFDDFLKFFTIIKTLKKEDRESLYAFLTSFKV
ncbi:helix-turn-helix transcriptional regulator [Aneurinibacillus migulanus]|uniref:helix-turn-helix domain-containing protein n=1 Tax=Aneurinibacillus migulanus TaxID=47500 RepID=UPI002E1F3AF0|nr:helix-turn-helix transcriptional regulator [Aneurinibacillus migulanus]